MEVDTPTAMETPASKAIIVIPGKTAKVISFRNGDIVAEKPEDQESWNGTVTEAKIDAFHMKFKCQRKTINMRRLGQGLYRCEDRWSLLLCGDIETPITVREHDNDYERMTEFEEKMVFQYFHPGQWPASLRIGCVEGEKKIRWKNEAPTGYWNIRPLNMTEEALKPYPKGMDWKNVLEIRFHYKGIESKEQTTLYVLVKGTKKVWRAVGSRLETGEYFLDPADYLERNKDWSIVLVAAEEINFNGNA